ncbi:hypothetical protein GCM10008025_26920 [Ornithinibacillus halotolerans]|uniref:Uncharacterized protein n=1 Tax=Ornithinibacillus halotolerans TaxID=1274357 RepID=A0A916WBA0_9BACI|nr:hypothetical protein GCM10008025_26920 [Ornithinibacillus halotolerans]
MEEQNEPSGDSLRLPYYFTQRVVYNFSDRKSTFSFSYEIITDKLTNYYTKVKISIIIKYISFFKYLIGD